MKCTVPGLRPVPSKRYSELKYFRQNKKISVFWVTGLNIFDSYEGQSKITESWLISFYWVGTFG